MDEATSTLMRDSDVHSKEDGLETITMQQAVRIIELEQRAEADAQVIADLTAALEQAKTSADRANEQLLRVTAENLKRESDSLLLGIPNEPASSRDRTAITRAATAASMMRGAGTDGIMRRALRRSKEAVLAVERAAASLLRDDGDLSPVQRLRCFSRYSSDPSIMTPSPGEEVDCKTPDSVCKTPHSVIDLSEQSVVRTEDNKYWTARTTP